MLVCANKNKFSHGAALIASCMSESFQDYSVAQSVTCLTTDTCPTADPVVASAIPARSHTFVEINHEIIYMAIHFPLLIQEGFCQLQGKVCAQSIG